jgi:DHA2 family methylenomycin A resistance protein-like MFS transporter
LILAAAPDDCGTDRFGAVIEVRPLGMTHPVVLGVIFLAIVAGSVLVVVEARTANPILPFSLFQKAGFTPAIFFGVLVNFSYVPRWSLAGL